MDNTATQPTQSLGERRVRASFNPSANSEVDAIKSFSAAMIDRLEELRKETDGSLKSAEIQRLLSLAQTSFEEGAMWGVKAVTG